MKRLLLTLFLTLILAKPSFCADFDYMKTYRELEPANFSYIHNIDPDHYYECKNYTWTPYPLFRLNSALYFKNISIEPGYYNLTPRDYKGKTYILFKEAGSVKYIIPVYKKEIVPEFFYEEHLPKPKLTFGQKFQIVGLDTIGKICKKSFRKPIPKSYLDVIELDNTYISIVIYYKEFRYYTIFRTDRM